MGFVEATYLILGIILGVIGIALLRWLLLRPTKHTLTSSLVEELNCFNAQIRRLAERMTELTESIRPLPKGRLTTHDLEIAETLSEMRRVLKEINQFFAREESEGTHLHVSDFLGPDELDKFQTMEEISEEEIAGTDWDDLLDRLRDEEK